MSVKDSEFDYVCPNCGADDIDVIEQEDIVNQINGRITHFKRVLLCNDCNHEWVKKHKVKTKKKNTADEFGELDIDYNMDLEDENEIDEEF